MDFNDLTDDQKEKARACKSVDELVALAKAEGVELTEDQLQSITGAGNWRCNTNTCEAKCAIVGY